MSPSRFAGGFALFASIASLLIGSASAQTGAPPSTNLAYEHDSGLLENTRPAAEVVISFPVVMEGAQWIRLYFEDVTLSGDLLAGEGSILRLTSLLDGGTQEMDSRHLKQWQNSSAYFNGDVVLVEVIAQPHTGMNRVNMRSVDFGLVPVLEESICGPTDDRTLSNDPRAARIMPIGCTGWLIDDCQQCLLTAGHCASGTSVLEFNVPLSNSNGSINHPSPDDQYSVDPASMQDNGGGGVGNDWAYFGAFVNTNTGLTPAEAAGSTYELALPPTVAGNNIRITGYGTDSTPATRNQVQQTLVGPMVTSSGSLVQYATDTTGGNSGSPVIWENTGQAIGIHTHGGCDSSGGQNSGTGANHTELQNALAAPRGICAAGLSFPQSLPTLVAEGVPVDLQVELIGSGSAVTLHYRLQGGAFIPLLMTLIGANTYEAQIPAPTCADMPEYYFSYMDAACGLITSPSGAPSEFFSAQVGTAQTVFADDFENDLGWTSNIAGATSGAWQRGVPVNDANWTYDPPADSDGSGSCYLTQNQFGNTDVDDGTVRLFSPIFDLSGAGAMVSYDYYLYLTIEDGIDKLEVSARNNGAGAWSVITAHTTSGGTSWRHNALTAADFIAAGVAASDSVQVRFTANDSGTQSIVEAGVDAFWVGSISCGAGVGSNYCTPGANGATISGSGSASVASNNLILEGSGIPQNVNGLFFYGNSQANLPLGNGTQCVSGSTGIFRLQPIQNSGATGQMSFAVDLTNPPSALGQITAGSTWFFQLWFRDAGSSDLTDGLEVSFTP